jgi:hypothetical protein
MMSEDEKTATARYIAGQAFTQNICSNKALYPGGEALPF